MRIRATTVLVVKRDGEVAIAGDGQVTVGDTVMKATARKIRTLYHESVLAGFAGAVADALTLFDKFEAQLEKHQGNLRRAAVELAKDWRTDRILRRLEAQLIIADRDSILLVSGDGEVIEPDGEILAIGSGGTYAQAAAIALHGHSTLNAAEIARRGLEIAADLCIYTNHNINVLTLDKLAEANTVS